MSRVLTPWRACSVLTRAQLLRKANFHTPKAWAMFRPSDMQLSSTAGDRSAPAQVAERHNLGWTIKYHLKFDDDVVGGRQTCTGGLCAGWKMDQCSEDRAGVCRVDSRCVNVVPACCVGQVLKVCNVRRAAFCCSSTHMARSG